MAGPIQKYRQGGITVSVWENAGSSGTYKSIQIEKQYQDKVTKEWKKSGRYFPGDLPVLHALIGEAMAALGEAPLKTRNFLRDYEQQAGAPQERQAPRPEPSSEARRETPF